MTLKFKTLRQKGKSNHHSESGQNRKAKSAKKITNQKTREQLIKLMVVVDMDEY